jgi:TetR/AcrR family transcriptional regulator
MPVKTKETLSRDNPGTSRMRLKAGERRDQLLGIARKLFAENGFENTTTKAIAAAAGVSEAIIFRHFSSKEALYASILDQKADEIGIRTWGAELDACAAREDDEALIFSVVKRILEADRKDPEFQKLMIQASLSGHPLHKITAQRLSPLQRFLCNYVKKRQKKGAFQKCDPRLAAYAIIGVPSYCGLSKILFGAEDLKLSEEQMALSFTRLLVEGLRVPSKLPRRKGIATGIPKGRRR